MELPVQLTGAQWQLPDCTQQSFTGLKCPVVILNHDFITHSQHESNMAFN